MNYVMTPRGLVIRMSAREVFGLISRLWTVDRKANSFRVLKLAEGIDSIGSTLAYLVGLGFALFSNCQAWQLVPVIIVTRVLGLLMIRFRMIYLIGIYSLSTVMSYVSGYGLFHFVALMLLGSMRGLDWMCYWSIGFVTAAVIANAIGFWIYIRLSRELRCFISQAECAFIMAYQRYAIRLGLNTDIELSDSELDVRYWGDCILEYASDCPGAVKRFAPRVVELAELREEARQYKMQFLVD